MICQCLMLAVLECSIWCWFHLKFYRLVMHEKPSCTNRIETRRVCFRGFFSHLKFCAPQVWLCESEGLLVYMNFLFPSTQNEKKKKNPTILWQNPRRFPLFGLRMSQSFVIVLEGPGGVLLIFPGPCFAFPALHLGVIRQVTNQSRKICMLI